MGTCPDFRLRWTISARTRRTAAWVWTSPVLALLSLRPDSAHAVPAFAEQTGQPCAACHVGAFGPQLKQYGRDFKLNGYVASDGKKHGPPVAVSTQLSFTHTNNAQPGPAAPDFAPNDNFAVDQTSAYYAGRITPWLGAFVQVTYDGIAKQLHIDNTDIRSSHDTDLFDEDLVYGFTVNNSPTLSDLWNSSPVWGFPYNGSALAPTPMAATLIDGGLGQRVVGGGSYMMWNDLVYAEVDIYRGLGYDVLNATGIVPVASTDKTRGLIPYWRLALQKNYGRSYFEFGTYGLSASVEPGGIDVPGAADWFVDSALDANYQFIVNPKSVTSDMVSAHATYIHEDASLKASEVLVGARQRTHARYVSRRCVLQHWRHRDPDHSVFPDQRHSRHGILGHAERQPEQQRGHRRNRLRALGQA